MKYVLRKLRRMQTDPICPNALRHVWTNGFNNTYVDESNGRFQMSTQPCDGHLRT